MIISVQKGTLSPQNTISPLKKVLESVHFERKNRLEREGHHDGDSPFERNALISKSLGHIFPEMGFLIFQNGSHAEETPRVSIAFSCSGVVLKSALGGAYGQTVREWGYEGPSMVLRIGECG